MGDGTALDTDSTIIFDLDGTLVDNMGIHADAFARFAIRHELPLVTPALRARLDGKRNRDIFPVLFGRALDKDLLARYAREKESLYRELSRGRLTPVPGLMPLLELLEARGIKCGVATSAPAENVEHTLSEIGLRARFSVVVRADEVPRGKPHPDVFLAAAEKLGARPEECTAFEDAPAGIEAARAAGMTCIAVATTFSAEFLTAYGVAHHVVRDFEEARALLAIRPAPPGRPRA